MSKYIEYKEEVPLTMFLDLEFSNEKNIDIRDDKQLSDAVDKSIDKLENAGYIEKGQDKSKGLKLTPKSIIAVEACLIYRMLNERIRIEKTNYIILPDEVILKETPIKKENLHQTVKYLEKLGFVEKQDNETYKITN